MVGQSYGEKNISTSTSAGVVTPEEGAGPGDGPGDGPDDGVFNN